MTMPLPNPNKQLFLPLEALSLKMKTGFSPLVCVVGDETGIGKSMFVARACELIYWRTYKKKWLPFDDKNKETNLFFYMDKFKTELFNARQRILIIDEAEIELGSDDWQSIANRWFSRMKSTQRIKGNLYFVVLPMFSLLAKKHRRAVNYIWYVKKRGFALCYKIKKKPAQILGDDISRFPIGAMGLTMPDCSSLYKFHDTENKKLIEKVEGLKYDYDTYKIKKKMEKFQKFLRDTNSTDADKKEYTYNCPNCNKILKTTEKLTLISCKKCKTLFQNEENNENNDNDDENNDDDGE